MAHPEHALLSPHQRGFTLVEMAIVLVIIGFLLGIIIGGQHLILQATLKNTITEATGYREATATFREVYSAWPGDMPNATSFWANTANGNDDQQVIGDSGGPSNNEGYRAWQHLSQAEMIKGNFPGTASGNEAVIGENVPEATVKGSGYFFHYFNLAPDKRNAITLGAFNSGTFNSNPALPPRDAEYIDRKMDDGLPRQGDVWAGGNGGTGACYTGTAYNLTSENTECILHFWLEAN